MSIEKNLESLQSDLSLIDMLSERSSNSGYSEFLVKKIQDIKLKMYQEKRHSNPHIHIDYGNQKHAASYAIKSGERLAGKLSKKYDKKISEWISQNCELLLQLWDTAKNGDDIEYLVAQIQGNT